MSPDEIHKRDWALFAMPDTGEVVTGKRNAINFGRYEGKKVGVNVANLSPEQADALGISNHDQQIFIEYKTNPDEGLPQPVNAAAIDAYKIKLPKDYIKEGDQYIYKPTPPPPAVTTGKAEVKQAEGGVVSGFKAPPMPDKFNSLEDALEYRQATKDAEIEFYKSLGFNDAEANKFFRSGDARSNIEVGKLEDKLTPENRARLDAFNTGEGQPVYNWDRQYNPENLVGETDRKTLANHVVANLSRESAPTELGDKLLHAAVALRQLKENGGTWSDVARALDSYTTKISGSQGDKAFVFKKYGEEIRKFSTQQGIDLPQGEFGAKIGAVTPLKQISAPPPPAVTTGKGEVPTAGKGDGIDTIKIMTDATKEDFSGNNNDEYLYHITTEPNAKVILESGLNQINHTPFRAEDTKIIPRGSCSLQRGRELNTGNKKSNSILNTLTTIRLKYQLLKFGEIQLLD